MHILTAVQADKAKANHEAPRRCKHCNATISRAYSDTLFCCKGCQFVYGLLHEKGLDAYYTIREESGAAAQEPVRLSEDRFSYLDDETIRAKHILNSDEAYVQFYLEGIHCVACLWLIEKIPQLVDGVKSAHLDFGKSIVELKYDPKASLAQVARTLNLIGYRPHLIEKNDDADEKLKEENRSWMLRIGVTGACMGNIMLTTIPSYSGITGNLSTLFSIVSAFLFLPVMFYSAVPFYKNAWSSFRAKTISIDTPIVLALYFGFAVSVIHLLQGSSDLYFDSLSALVLLLLSSRYALKRIQQNAMKSSELFQFLAPTSAHRLTDVNKPLSSYAPSVEVSVQSLCVADLVLVKASEVIPIDGVIVWGKTQVNCALLNGESMPVQVGIGAEVFAGTVNVGADIVVQVRALVQNGRLGKIIQQIQNGAFHKSSIITGADRIAKWFLAIVIVTSLTLMIASSDIEEGIRRALALVIVTCPCALALATPLAMRMALSRAARLGILIKNSEILEKLSRIKNIFLDKTGTLTYGNFTVLEWVNENPKEELHNAELVYSLEKRSKHLIASALISAIETKYDVANKALDVVEEFEEIVGLGVRGKMDGKYYELYSNRDSTRTSVKLICENKVLATITLGDRVRKEAASFIKTMQKANIETHILSGDNAMAVEKVGSEIGISSQHIHAQQSPEEKSEIIKKYEQVLMVGDGANDALALATADVSVAVKGSMEVSLRAADVFITKHGLKPLLQMMTISKETMKVINRNFAFSILYNLVGGYLAVKGEVSPLFAAVLMPLSAFTVFASSLYGTKTLRKTENDVEMK